MRSSASPALPQSLYKVEPYIIPYTIGVPTVPVIVPALICFWMRTDQPDCPFAELADSRAGVSSIAVVSVMDEHSTLPVGSEDLCLPLNRPFKVNPCSILKAGREVSRREPKPSGFYILLPPIRVNLALSLTRAKGPVSLYNGILLALDLGPLLEPLGPDPAALGKEVKVRPLASTTSEKCTVTYTEICAPTVYKVGYGFGIVRD